GKAAPGVEVAGQQPLDEDGVEQRGGGGLDQAGEAGDEESYDADRQDQLPFRGPGRAPQLRPGEGMARRSPADADPDAVEADQGDEEGAGDQAGQVELVGGRAHLA